MVKNVHLESLLRRMKGDDFDPFRTYLSERIGMDLRALSKASEPIDIYRLQGRVNALTDLLKEVTFEGGSGDTARTSGSASRPQRRS